MDTARRHGDDASPLRDPALSGTVRSDGDHPSVGETSDGVPASSSQRSMSHHEVLLRSHPSRTAPLSPPTPSSRTHLCCEDVLSRRGLRLPPECACRGAVAGGRTQSSGEKYVPDPTSDASVHARRPRNREGPRGAVCRSQARAASDARRPPGRRWPAGWRTEPRACCRAGACEVCDARGTCDGAVGDCVRCTSPRGNVQLLGPQLREGRAQDVSAGWHDWGASLRLLPPERLQCPGRGGEELGRR